MAAVGALASDAGDRVVVLGGRRSADLAAESGCVVSSTVPLPLGQPRLAGRNLRAAWKSGEERHVVAWSERAAVAATLLPQELEIEGRVAAVAGPKPWIEPWLRNRIRIRPIGPDVGAALARRGWRTGSVIPIEDLARPAEHELSRRNQLRRAWGAEPDELVVGCVADPPGSLDLVLAYNSLVVCRVSGRKVRLVAHPGSGRSAAARQWARGLDVHGPPLATYEGSAAPTSRVHAMYASYPTIAAIARPPPLSKSCQILFALSHISPVTRLVMVCSHEAATFKRISPNTHNINHV